MSSPHSGAPVPTHLYSGHHAIGLKAALRDLFEGLMLWELWGRLCWNEIRRRYRRTAIGPMWVSISLGVFALVLSVVWSALFNLNVREYLPFLLSGMLPWTMLAGCLSEASFTFVTAESMMKSRQFPYTMLIHVVVARNLIIFGHNLIVYILAAVFCGVAFTGHTLLIFPGLLLLVVNLSWMTLFTAILCLRFRDFQQIITLMLQIAMLITPVFWPASQLTGRKTILVDANLLYHLIEVVREPLLGKSAPVHSYVFCIATAVVGWVAAITMLTKKRHRLVYWF